MATPRDPQQMVRRMLSRRGLLRHTALAALLSPAVRRREAGAASAPRRVILIFSPNGCYEVAGPASGSTTAFTLHDWWSPLERHRARGIFLSHMAPPGAGVVAGAGHALGGTVFSGSGANYGGSEYRNAGPTIDQIIARRLEQQGKQGAVRSVTWGLAPGATGEAFSAGMGRDIVPEMSPLNAWRSLFAQFVPPSSGGAQAAAALLARKKSMLDFVVRDCQSMRGALGAEGSALLEDHCATLRTMEQAVMTGLNEAAEACVKPASPQEVAWTNPENIDAQFEAFSTLMVSALACELTHVIAFQFAGQAARNRLASRYGVPSAPTVDSGDSGPAHHPWTHVGASSARTQALRIFQTFYSTKMALLLDKLASAKDGSGASLMESTVVLWIAELGAHARNFDNHNTAGLPISLFGSGQGTFRTGRYIRGQSGESQSDDRASQRAAGADTARLLVSMLHYMGLTDVSTVGATGVSGTYAPLYG